MSESGTVQFLMGMITFIPVIIALVIYLPSFATGTILSFSLATI